MSDFELTSTSGSPGVHLIAKTGDCKFTGYSIPQKTNDFYAPILSWFKEYANNPAKETRLTMCMEYMDNASRKIFLGILKLLKKVQDRGHTIVSVTWLSNMGNDDMLGLGEKFAELVELDFTFGNLD